MVILGLTGGIAMGKSTVSAHLLTLGAAVHDSDECVHRIYRTEEACTALSNRFGTGVIGASGVDRQKLSELLVSLDPGAKTQAFADLNAIVHPLVEKDRREFVETTAAKRECWLCVLDVPLLFESGLHRQVDSIVVVSAPPEFQRERCLAREGMTVEKFESIMARQADDAFRRENCDFLVDSSIGIPAMKAQIAEVVESLARGSQTAPTAYSVPLTPVFTDWAQKAGSSVAAVTFDLDDTIWSTMPPILRACDRLCRLLEAAVGESVTHDEVHKAMAQAAEACPWIQHDMTAQRAEGLRVLLTERGLDAEQVAEITDRAMAAFCASRSDVIEDLYEDSLRTLRTLRESGLVVGAITNGNFEMDLCPVVAGCFDFCVTAGDCGEMKPGIVPFLMASSRAGVPVGQIVHVGDSVPNDLKGALGCGIRAVLLDREGIHNGSESLPKPDPDKWAVVTSLDEVLGVLQQW